MAKWHMRGSCPEPKPDIDDLIFGDMKAAPSER